MPLTPTRRSLRSVPTQAIVYDFAAARAEQAAQQAARKERLAQRRADRIELQKAWHPHPAVRDLVAEATRTASQPNNPPPATVAVAWARFDGPRCACCGKPLPAGGWLWRSLQHRIPRQAGGHRLSNLIGLCGSATSSGCHRLAEDRTAQMREWGFWIGAEEHLDPRLVPVHVLFGDGVRRPVWLDDDGSWSLTAPVPPDGDAA